MTLKFSFRTLLHPAQLQMFQNIHNEPEEVHLRHRRHGQLPLLLQPDQLTRNPKLPKGHLLHRARAPLQQKRLRVVQVLRGVEHAEVQSYQMG